MELEITLESMLYGLRCPDEKIRRATWMHFCSNYGQSSIFDVKNINFEKVDCWGNPLYSKEEMYGHFLTQISNTTNISIGNHFIKILEQDNSVLATKYIIYWLGNRINSEHQNQLVPILQNRIDWKSDADLLILMLENVQLHNCKVFLTIAVSWLPKLKLTVTQWRKIANIIVQDLSFLSLYREYIFELLKNIHFEQNENCQNSVLQLWQCISCCNQQLNGGNHDYWIELFLESIEQYCNYPSDFELLFAHEDSPLNKEFFSFEERVSIILKFIDYRNKKIDANLKITNYIAESSLVANICKWIKSQIVINNQQNYPVTYSHIDIVWPLCKQLATTSLGHLKTRIYNTICHLLMLYLYPHNAPSEFMTWQQITYINQKIYNADKYFDLLKYLLQKYGSMICSNINQHEFLRMCSLIHGHPNMEINTFGKELLSFYFNDVCLLRMCLNALNNGEFGEMEEAFVAECADSLNIYHKNFPYSQFLQFLYRMAYNQLPFATKNTLFKIVRNLSDNHLNEFSAEEQEILQNLCDLQNESTAKNEDVAQYLLLKKIMVC